MYKIELDENNIIRGKYTIDDEVVTKNNIEGIFVTDEIGQSLELPCEPMYDKEGNITSGTYRPDLMPTRIPQPSLRDRLTLLENTISGISAKMDVLSKST